MLRPPSSVLRNTFLFIKSCISRNAVSGEHLVIFPHLDEVSFPLKLSVDFVLKIMGILQICCAIFGRNGLEPGEVSVHEVIETLVGFHGDILFFEGVE